MNIAIVGTGYVGLVTGVCFAEFGLHVTGVDTDEERIAQLAKGEVLIYEPQLGEMLRRNLQQGRIQFTTDTARAVRESLVVFIAVGTPSKEDGSADLRYVEEVARTVARNLNGYKVIVTKSTVPVGTGRRIQSIIHEENGTGSQGVFDIASNPEFLREGSAIEDFLRPNRVVIGADSPQAVAILQDLYRPLYLIEVPFVITTIETAELIKYASNSFLATKITFMNEMANLCEVLGVDIHVVAKAMGLDQRIGPKFLHPGPGFGGSCLPKDTWALVNVAREHGCRTHLVETVIEVNEQQKLRMAQKIISALGASPDPGSLEGITVGVLGLAFKPNTDDVRQAPSLAIIGELQRLGALVQAYDPAAMEQARRILPAVDYRIDAYSAAEGADVLVLATEWNQFRNLNLEKVKKLMRRPVLVDLRNVYEPERVRMLGFTYCGIGR
ncbi:MAG: UDP-glucose/GDP-mannose dehydrogenase family protein [candidate division NC10 bacterium]|nr:UDP-glucose/GDP-mannose dehydrogenase family protein [candidate division NC10 bacterium]MDE2321862.1 UDP-glucose/GDP-mannose dehydrogenase family protein [candidate division NC10 bacterium]